MRQRCRRAPGEAAPSAGSQEEVFLAFGRVFSGVAREGQTVRPPFLSCPLPACPLPAYPCSPGSCLPAWQRPDSCEASLAARAHAAQRARGQCQPPCLQVHVLSAAYSPGGTASRHRQTATLRGLYLMMGRALERLEVGTPVGGAC
jgi:hypothetical protein